MSLKTLLCTLLFLGYLGSSLLAQEPAEISPPELSMGDEGVVIQYRILNSDRQTRFTISVQITRAGGEIIPASALRGDIGKGITGSGTKTIIWDLEADGIYLDEEIFVEVIALPEQTVDIPPPGEEMEEAPPVIKNDAPSRSMLMLNSLIFPGWGLSKYTSNPHWIKGIAAYGCLAGSVVMNRYAYKTYQNYLDPDHPDDKLNTFNDADTRKSVATALGVAALAIWIADLGWTFIATAPGKGMQISATTDPLMGAPMMQVTYRF